MTDAEQVLDGGNMGGAVRAGDTVRRPAGPWSPTVQRLLAHLRRRGLDWVPRPLGVDEQGRDRVSFLPGTVPQDPLPAFVWSDRVLIAAGRYLADLHAASATFDRAAATWQLPVHHPAEVICHNDFAPYNMVFDAGRLTGVIDWDTASPGPRSWDLAYLAYRLVPLTDPANADGLDNDLAERARRLRLLCDTYGHRIPPREVLQVAVVRLHDLAAFTAARVADGQAQLSDHVALYRRDAAWVAGQTDALAALRPGGRRRPA